MSETLAMESDIGRVFRCPNCQDVHVRWGDWMFKLSPDAFLRFQVMIEQAGHRVQEGAAPDAPLSKAKEGLWRH